MGVVGNRRGVETLTTPGEADLDRLYREHYRAVLRYVVRRTGVLEDAHDVVADVFLVAWQRRADMPAERALPWLYGVAANLLSHLHRSGERAARAYRRVGNDLATRTVADPAELVEQADAAARTLTVLRELRPSDQEVLLLHAWEELRGKDLGTALGCSAAAAAVRLYRARRRLADHVRSTGQPSTVSATSQSMQGENA